jgi:hypothetical protein
MDEAVRLISEHAAATAAATDEYNAAVLAAEQQLSMRIENADRELTAGQTLLRLVAHAVNYR